MRKNFYINKHHYIFDGEQLELYLKEDHNSQKIEDSKKITIVKNNDILYKLVFNVSNMCNLNCKYCYASGGNYNRSNHLMSVTQAKEILKEVFSKFKKVKTIYFFGGEPLLNFKVIKYIVEELEKHYNGKEMEYRIVTNGIFLTKQKIDFLTMHDFKIYISIDGPKHIHDYLRGKGTFDIIIKQLNELKQTAIASKVELLCTYTRYHQKHIDFDSLNDFFEKLGYNYSINGVDTKDLKLKLQEEMPFIKREKEYIDTSMDRIISNSKNIGISYYLIAIIEALLFHRKQKYFCKELADDYSIVYDFNGDKYNCIRLLGKYKKDNNAVINTNQKKENICQKCWCKNICTICVAEILLKNDNYPYINGKCKIKPLYEYAMNQVLNLLEEDKDKMTKLLNNYCENFIK